MRAGEGQMDDHIGRLVANVGDDRTAAVMAAGVVVGCLRAERRSEGARARASRRPTSGLGSELTLSNSSGRRTGTCAADETVGAIFHRLYI
jgi:hypothetical protein